MKFMKLGSRPDTFQAEGSCVRYMPSELETDVVINVGDVKFSLHKFPLLSKSNRLQSLASKANDESQDEIPLPDFPGGPKAFEICAKFCYGVTVTLNPYNVAAARCAAEYLEMAEDVERGNLILKIEIFLNSSVLRSWKDTIIVLQSTTSLLPWSENLRVVARCIDSIASKTLLDPSAVTWSYTHSRKSPITATDIIQSGTKLTEKMGCVPKDWWIEDLCELEICLYKRVMIAIKSNGMDGGMIAEALKAYALRWLPESVNDLVSEDRICWNKYLLETILCLLPQDKGLSCPCSFLLKLLKVAAFVGADELSWEDLIRSACLKLDEASVSDLLIPSRAPDSTTIYDTELVRRLMVQFMANEKMKFVESAGGSGSEFVSGRASLMKVGKILDGYLASISHDPNLSVSSFIELVQSIPDSARLDHDGLYAAITLYLKEHGNLTKSERKRLCGLMDVKKFTTGVAMHAAQNEQLPLRLVVQILFFEQVKAAAAAAVRSPATACPLGDTEETWKDTPAGNDKTLRKQMDEMDIKEGEPIKNRKLIKNGSKNGSSGPQLLPSRSRRIFDRLWNVGKGHENGENNKSSETSASSQSPSSMVKGEGKSSGLSSSRNRRHSIS